MQLINWTEFLCNPIMIQQHKKEFIMTRKSMYPLPDIFESFTEARQNSFIELKELKEKGYPVVGVYCGFVPWEIVAASGAISASLCGKHEAPISVAEKHLPRNLCPLIKSSYGSAISDQCPLFYYSDLLIGETTCDGKKKMYEMLEKLKPMHVIDIPNTPNSLESFKLYYSELQLLRTVLEKHFSVTITDNDIHEKIKLRNEERRALREFYELGQMVPPPIWGYDLRKVLEGTKFIADKRKEIDNIQSLKSSIIENNMAHGSIVPTSAKRILVTGTPLGESTEKIIKIIEDNGGVVVCYENCGSAKNMDDEVDEFGDPIAALTKRHLKSACACMSPNEHRKEMIHDFIHNYKVDGVIDVILNWCHTYNVETGMIKRVANASNVPYLNLETDYSQSDIGQLTTRIVAFIELL